VHHRLLRAAAVASACALVLTACGQKPGVHVGDGGLALAGGDGSGGEVALDTQTGTTGDDLGAGLDAGGEGTGSAQTPGGAASGDGAAIGTGAAGGSGDDSAQASGTQQQSAGATQGQEPTQQQSQQPTKGRYEPQGTDRTGANKDQLVFASHAPVTGAAPLPTTSFEKAGDLYWRDWTERQSETVLGRSKVTLIFRDDKYDPNSARQVCRELESKAFTISGGGGTDQIQACGQFAGVAKFPYFSAGVTEAGLTDNPWYFAASMSYRQQGRLLANYVRRNPNGVASLEGGPKVAAIITDTPNFDDAVEGWTDGVQAEGLDYYKTLRHPKGDTSWYSGYAQDLMNAGVEVVYILSSPLDYIRFAQKAEEQGYRPQYIGVGVSMGLNAVLQSGCPWVDGGIFFSPFPGLDWARANVPQFFEAAAHFQVPNDDIALALWGTNAVLHQLLQRYEQAFGSDLTREDFRVLVENSQDIETGIFPQLDYTPDDHFGSSAVHVLQASCEESGGDDEYVTLETFASGF
jgi:ABC-type branched-subunit amino acid transport system substrate-binding protein